MFFIFIQTLYTVFTNGRELVQDIGPLSVLTMVVGNLFRLTPG